MRPKVDSELFVRSSEPWEECWGGGGPVCVYLSWVDCFLVSALAHCAAGLVNTFRVFGSLSVEWPGKDGKHPRCPPKGNMPKGNTDMVGIFFCPPSHTLYHVVLGCHRSMLVTQALQVHSAHPLQFCTFLLSICPNLQCCRELPPDPFLCTSLQSWTPPFLLNKAFQECAFAASEACHLTQFRDSLWSCQEWGPTIWFLTGLKWDPAL